MASINIEVKEAALNSLVLGSCGGVQNLVESLKDKLHSLESLTIDYCEKLGKKLIEELCQTTCVQFLEYRDFSAACMPRSFPQSLRELELFTHDWPLNLPERLRELRNLKDFHCDIECVSWEITRPLDELLPIDSLENLRLGCHILDCTGAKAWRSDKLPRDVLKCADRQSTYTLSCQHT